MTNEEFEKEVKEQFKNQMSDYTEEELKRFFDDEETKLYLREMSFNATNEEAFKCFCSNYTQYDLDRFNSGYYLSSDMFSTMNGLRVMFMTYKAD